MPFQPDSDIITWKIHLKSSPIDVYEIISTDDGRNRFWAETLESNEIIKYHFPNGYDWEGKILLKVPPTKYSLIYIDNSVVTFMLESDLKGGTDLTLTDKGVDPKYRTEVIAGWGSVLMALKAAIDFNVDLRNHDSLRTWDQGYFDN